MAAKGDNSLELRASLKSESEKLESFQFLEISLFTDLGVKLCHPNPCCTGERVKAPRYYYDIENSA